VLGNPLTLDFRARHIATKIAPTIPRIDLRMNDLELLVDRARQAPLTEEEYTTLNAAIDTLGYVAQLGARHIDVPHPHLQHGDSCPACANGKVYRQREPGVLIRLVGQAPIAAKVYALEKLLCHLCGELFTADPPSGVGWEKYDATTGAMIALLKYGSGMPVYRLERLQASAHIPLPASTQWDTVADTAGRIRPALDELMRQAAQGDILHTDDTSMTVLDLRPGSPRGDPEDDVSPDRTGVFTSGIVSTRDGHRVALFVTGRRHAGENLARVLAARTADLGAPTQMCDALSRNLPKPLAVIVGHCLAHARRHVVEVTPNFPAECRHTLETLWEVYRYDAEPRGLSPDARLTFHQTQSGPLMDRLPACLTAQIDGRRIEPNSGIGHVIAYLLKYWAPLTLFLRQPGAPLENNLCERGLKQAIRHRKNALFYKTTNGLHWRSCRRSLHERDSHVGTRRGESLRRSHVAPNGTPRPGREPDSLDTLDFRETLAQLNPAARPP
jgi:transposase